MGFSQDEDRTMITPPHSAALGEISETRPMPPDQPVPQTVALPSGEYSAPRTVTLDEYNAPSAIAPPASPTAAREPPSMAVVLALSTLVFLFTATVTFAIVALALS